MRLFERLPQIQHATGDVNLSQELANILNLTDKLAQNRNDSYISSELFVLAAMDAKGELPNILKQSGADKKKLDAAIDQIRGGSKLMIPMQKILDKL